MDKKIFTEIDPAQCLGECASRIFPDWMLLAAGQEGKEPAFMTVNWGAFGYLWGKPMVMVALRESRHTLPYVLDNKAFSLSFFDASWRETLLWCGRHSGHEVNKMQHCKFHTAWKNGVPYFTECQTALICGVMYVGAIKPENFVNGKVYRQWYTEGEHKDNMHKVIFASMDHVLEGS